MQTVKRPWGVVVHGAAQVKAVPDLMRARFKVSRTEQAPSEAFAVASDAVRAVRQALRDHGVPDAAVEGSRLDLRSSYTYGGSVREFVGYQCEAAFSVESKNLDDVQPLLVDLVAAGANEIDSVEFDVTTKGELRAAARKKAVAAARTKAELYAEAAGVRVGVVVHIEDVDPDQVAREGYRLFRGYSDDASTEDLAPGHVVVSAAVTLGFLINRDP